PSPSTGAGTPILTAVKIAMAAPAGEPVADCARLRSGASGRRSVRSRPGYLSSPGTPLGPHRPPDAPLPEAGELLVQLAPIARRPRRTAASSAVPVPANGSSTTHGTGAAGPG